MEVKYRKDHEFGSPLEKITPAQMHRIHQTASVFFEQSPQYEKSYFRFDAVGISPYDHQVSTPLFAVHTFQNFTIEWIQNAF